MRKSAQLAVASACWLLLGGCSASPTHPAQHEPRSSVERARSPGAAPATGAEPAPATALVPAAGSSNASVERLAERYARARPLAVQHGSASYYADKFAGRRTASGAIYEPRAMTAAHRNLPFGTVVRVTRSDGGRSVYVRVTDRGPFAKGRIVDLSRAAAEELGMLRAGVVKIKLEVVEYGPPRKARRRRR